MTSEDIRKVTFEKTMRGYRTEDVDDFLSKAADIIDDITAERDAAIQASRDMEEKMYILAQKVEEYRGQEDTLKTALINAQRMGETVVHEAKIKADSLLRDASGKAEMLRQQTETEILNEQQTLESLQAEVTRFKATVLNLYKQHIESLSALDQPVVRVDEFLREVGFEKPIPPLEGSNEIPGSKVFTPVEPQVQEDIDYDAFEIDEDISIYGDEYEDDDREPIPAKDLFEGIPVDPES